MGEQVWRLPYGRSHAVSAKAGPLVFVGGAGDFRRRRRGCAIPAMTSTAQIEGAMANVAEALALEGAGLEDIVRLKAFYTANPRVTTGLACDRHGWSIQSRRALLPAVTANPVPLAALRRPIGANPGDRPAGLA